MSEHLARHWLERALVADPRDPLPDEARAHLALCAQCAERMQRMARARAEFAATRPAARFAAAVSTRAARTATAAAPSRLRRRAPWLAAALAAALVALGLRAAFAPAAPVDPSAIRYKGPHAELRVFVEHGGERRALRSGEALVAGDQLAFAYSLRRPQHLMLLGIDDAGTVTRYFPEGPLEASAALPDGDHHQLPVGIELDGRRGQERLVALFSDVRLSEVRAFVALRAELQLARARGKGIPELGEPMLPDTTQVSVWFEKP